MFQSLLAQFVRNAAWSGVKRQCCKVAQLHEVNLATLQLFHLSINGLTETMTDAPLPLSVLAKAWYTFFRTSGAHSPGHTRRDRSQRLVQQL